MCGDDGGCCCGGGVVVALPWCGGVVQVLATYCTSGDLVLKVTTLDDQGLKARGGDSRDGVAVPDVASK